MVSPPVGTFKLNIDGSFDIHTNSGAIGYVLRDHAGTVVLHYGEQVSVASAFESEAVALVVALKAVAVVRFPFVQVESDCLSLVKAVVDGQLCPVWPARKWVEEAGAQLQSSKFPLSYIPRTCNLAADWIVKSAAKGLV